MCLTYFIDWRYIHSWLIFSFLACEQLPPWTKGRNYTCVLLPFFSLASPTPFPLPKVNIQSWYFWTCMGHRNRFQEMNSASLCSLAGRYNNPIPTRCLAPIDFLKIPAQYIQTVCGCGGWWGGDELCCRPHSSGVWHSISDQIQNLKNCYTPQIKITSKDDM